MNQRFYPAERLKSRKEIERLFGPSGQAVKSYPLRLAFVEAEEVRGSFPFQAGFVVPKRRFRRATDRNRIKRLMREAYRLEKHRIRAHTEPGIPVERQFALMFIYTGKEEMDFRYVRKKMRRVLDDLLRQIQPAG